MSCLLTGIPSEVRGKVGDYARMGDGYHNSFTNNLSVYNNLTKIMINRESLHLRVLIHTFNSYSTFYSPGIVGREGFTDRTAGFMGSHTWSVFLPERFDFYINFSPFVRKCMCKWLNTWDLLGRKCSWELNVWRGGIRCECPRKRGQIQVILQQGRKKVLGGVHTHLNNFEKSKKKMD